MNGCLFVERAVANVKTFHFEFAYLFMPLSAPGEDGFAEAIAEEVFVEGELDANELLYGDELIEL